MNSYKKTTLYYSEVIGLTKNQRDLITFMKNSQKLIERFYNLIESRYNKFFIIKPITNAMSQRRRMGSFVKHVRSISTTVLKPLIQVNNIVNLQGNEKKLENQVIVRQKIKSIQENRKTIDNCSKRLQQLFKEDSSNQVSRVQSHLEQRSKKKKLSIDFIRNLY